MRYLIAAAFAAAALMAACAQPSTDRDRPVGEQRVQPGDQASAVGRPAEMSKEAQVYEQVLRRYLSSPSENSFPEPFKTVYVLDRAYPDIADPMGGKSAGVTFAPETKAQILAALGPSTPMRFITDPKTVIVDSDGCAKVKDDGMLITLGTLDGDDRAVKVGVHGFVACLGATWLTYVVENPSGKGWSVTGTTGSMAIS